MAVLDPTGFRCRCKSGPRGPWFTGSGCRVVPVPAV
jgi:hypothetical protein